MLSNKIRDNINVEKKYKRDEFIIECYPGQLNQVFMNILTNAIEAITGSGTIAIDLKHDLKQVQIIISDTGMGISPKDSVRIFDPFYSTKGPKEGTGLGLSISQSIIFKHKGKIQFSSNIPSGAIVTITLPIFQRETPKSNQAKSDI